MSVTIGARVPLGIWTRVEPEPGDIIFPVGDTSL